MVKRKVSKKRVLELTKAIKELKRVQRSTVKLEGYRPYVAVQMQLEVYRVELARAKAGKEPLYKFQWYSDL